MDRLSTPSLKNRRLIASLLTACAIAFALWLVKRETDRLGNPAYVSGFTLLACIALLMLLGVRRRLPFWPLGQMRIWTQVHLYTGIFALAVYVAHVPVILADGIFESTLSVLFLGVSASGGYGVFASRTLPKRLTAVEGQHRFDRVRWVRQEIARSAKTVYDEVNGKAAKDVISVFYETVLGPFFVTGPSVLYVIAPGIHRRRRLLGDLKELDRYLEDDGRQAAGKLAALVRRRDDLDYQFALQLRLRCWVVVHSVLSILLFAASIVHAAIALRFTW